MEAAKKKNTKDRWDAQHTRVITMKLNCNTDADLLAALDQSENKQGFIKTALRQYLKSTENK